MLENLRAEGPLLVVDAGNALWKGSVLSETEKAQQERKAKLIAETFEISGMDGMGIGEGELVFGLPWLQQLQKDHHLPYLASNLECDGGHPFETGRVVEKGGVKIGIVGVVGNSLKVEGCHVSEPVASVNAAFAALGPVDLKVVVSTEHLDEDRKLSSGVADLDFIVNGADRREMGSPDSLPGGGLSLAAGSRGKKVGVLTIDLAEQGHSWRDKGELGELANRRDQHNQHLQEAQTRLNASTDPKEQERLKIRITYYQKEIAKLDAQLAERAAAASSRNAKNRFAELGTDVADHPATAARVAVAKNDIAALAPSVPTQFNPSGPFVGSGACVVCHAAEASHWSTTAHANAYASLVAQNRQKDQACFGCHITGMFHPDGPKAAGAVAGLENVGCEACHGPGRDHAATPSQVKMGAKVEMIVCTTCHDSKQDGGRFEPDAYFARIRHPISSLNADGTLKNDPKLKPEGEHHFVLAPDGAPPAKP